MKLSKFTHAGVSRLKGEFKARFANDSMRVKLLAKNGHTDIDIVELPQPMTKVDALTYLLSIDFDNGNAAVRSAIQEGLDSRKDKTAPAKAAKPSLEKIRAKKTSAAV